jgi:hypothetical protein
MSAEADELEGARSDLPDADPTKRTEGRRLDGGK